MFVGYSHESKGFWIYDLVARKVIMSRDVVFPEIECMQPVNVDLPPNDDTSLDIIQFEGDEMDSP